MGHRLILSILLFYSVGTNKPTEVKKLELKKVERIYKCDISTFHANIKECGSNYTAFSTGEKIKHNAIFNCRAIAIDRYLGFKLLDTIEIIEPFEFSGKWVIKSFTAKRIRNRIDILISNDQKGTLIKNVKFRKVNKK